MTMNDVIDTKQDKVLLGLDAVNAERGFIAKWFWLVIIGGFLLHAIVLTLLSIGVNAFLPGDKHIVATIIVCSVYVVSVLFAYLFVIFNYVVRIEHQGFRLLDGLLCVRDDVEKLRKEGI